MLFLSDHAGEIAAAAEAGWQTQLVDREGKAAGSVGSLAEINVERAAMIIDGKETRPLILNADGVSIRVLDQRQLPWAIEWADIADAETAALAIKQMWVRGAPMLAVTGAYGLCMALRLDPSDANLQRTYDMLLRTRPTAVNLQGALNAIVEAVKPLPPELRAAAGYRASGGAM